MASRDVMVKTLLRFILQMILLFSSVTALAPSGEDASYGFILRGSF